jgi:mono/diheme cytochrome c family protein
MPKRRPTLPACLAYLTLAVALVTIAGGAGCKRKEVEGSTRAEAKHLFDSVCAKCHGADGRGGVPSAEGQPAPRNFADPSFQASRSDEDLRRAIREGKGPMPPFGALFDQAQTTLLVDYIRQFNTKK